MVRMNDTPEKNSFVDMDGEYKHEPGFYDEK